MVKYRNVYADLRLTGNRTVIDQTLKLLADAGCTWTSDGKYYQRGTLVRDYYLRKLRGPLLDSESSPIAQSNDPQPGPYDAVLGGKGRSD